MASKKTPITYAEAGVSISAADKLVDYLKKKNSSIGGFGGLFPMPASLRKPVLVASTDGVGTKLLVAKALGDYSTIGQDLVGMVVNDILVCGAQPLFFLDYYATGKLELKEARSIIDGILKGCELAGCPLIGGETAELPGLYREGDFDLAGFAIGAVEAGRVIDGRAVAAGDLVFGFESTGLHSNGYSLARRVLMPEGGAGPLAEKMPGAKSAGATIGRELMRPTKIYARLTSALAGAKVKVKAYAHITGGGIPGNLNRVLPKTVDAVVREGAWPVPKIFGLLEERGPVERAEMYATFNMGLGLMGVVAARDRRRLEDAAQAAGERVHFVGEIVGGGTGRVRLERE